MVKPFSKSTETRDELSTTCNPKVMSRCLSALDASLPLEPLSIFHFPKLNSGVLVVSQWGFFTTAIVVLYQVICTILNCA